MNPSFLCIIFLILGCSSTQNYSSTKKPETLKRAEQAVLLGKNRDASRFYSRFIVAYPNSPYIGDAYYQLGRQALMDQKFNRARRELYEASNRGTRETTRVLSLLALAQSWEKDSSVNIRERHQQALKIYEELWNKHRSVIPGEHVLYGAGECSLVLSLKDDATKWFRQLLKEYPKSEKAQEVRDRGLTHIHQHSVQVGGFGKLENARELMRKLQRDGFDPFLIKKDLYLVRVGKFRTYEAARLLAEKLSGMNYSGFLVP